MVVVNPGWGDSVQANKAGLMEIADVFVINKADRKGTEETRRDLEQMLELSDLAPDDWRPPIVAAVAIERKGIDAYMAKSHLRVFMTSNERWVVPATGDERRYAVFDCSNEYQGNHAYFQAMADQMKRDTEAGMPPREVADRVFRAIRDESFYILTHPEFRPLIEARMTGRGCFRRPRLPFAATNPDGAIRR